MSCRIDGQYVKDGDYAEINGVCYYCGLGQTYYQGPAPCARHDEPDLNDKARDKAREILGEG